MKPPTNKSISLQFTLADEAATFTLAAQLAPLIPAGCIIFLYGQLGAGKTTFTRGLLRAWQYQGKVKSPTYTLVEPYTVSAFEVFHFDLYRLHHPEELQHIGIAEYFSKQSVCIIEWPEKGLSALPKPDLACYIKQMPEGRALSMEAHSAQGVHVLTQLQLAIKGR